MKDSLLRRLEQLAERREEIDGLLASPEIIGVQDRFRALSRERAEIDPLVTTFAEYRQAESALAQAYAMQDDADPDLRAMANEEVASTREQIEALEQRINILLLPRDPADDANIFLEIRAGTGGDEAALFAADLFRMYGKYAETQGWQVEILSDALAESRRSINALVALARADERAALMQLFTDPENQPTQFGTVTAEYMQREILAEREACAKVCDDYDVKYDVCSSDTAESIAQQIRARGNT